MVFILILFFWFEWNLLSWMDLFCCSYGVKTFWLLHLIRGSCPCSHFAMKCTVLLTLSLSILSLFKYYGIWRECFQFWFIKEWLEHMITVVTNFVFTTIGIWPRQVCERRIPMCMDFLSHSPYRDLDNRSLN